MSIIQARVPENSILLFPYAKEKRGQFSRDELVALIKELTAELDEVYKAWAPEPSLDMLAYELRIREGERAFAHWGGAVDLTLRPRHQVLERFQSQYRSVLGNVAPKLEDRAYDIVLEAEIAGYRKNGR